MDFISTYGLFLAKAVTLVVAVAAIVMIIMNAALRKRAQNGQLRLTHLGDDYQQMKEDLQLAKMKPQAQKVWLKNHK
ncbi:MAG TPA: protease SohB, partial [Pantoea sp.]|nr:protease SohB [Pantoea sp.]